MPKQDSKPMDQPELSFEEAIAKLEEIVGVLEDGQTGLEDAMNQYEVGVGLLKECHHILKRAERKVELLTGVDDQGRAAVEPIDEEDMSLVEKADRRGQRRSRKIEADSASQPASSRQERCDSDVSGGRAAGP